MLADSFLAADHATLEGARVVVCQRGDSPAGMDPNRWLLRMMQTATKPFTKTAKQHEAIALLKGDARHILLYGGGRSGKTLLLLYVLVYRALKTKSRHLILRLHFNHIKTSIWMDSLPKVLDLAFRDPDTGKPVPVEWNNTDYFITFPNGSEIWIGGLDDKERSEKILGTEYCVDPKSLILKSDLSWVHAETLKCSDEIIGFDEDLDGHRTLIPSIVERSDIITAERYKIVTSMGETIVSTHHQFVTRYDDRRHINYRTFSWREANQLSVGDEIQFGMTPWDIKDNREDGWMGGMMDGEGWVGKHTKQSGKASHDCAVAQNKGLVLDAMKAWLDNNKIDYREYIQNPPGNCYSLKARDIWNAMRLLGLARPMRLDGRLIWNDARAFNRPNHLATIIDIISLGRGPVVALGTSTKTFIADGFLGHNSTIFFNECSQLTYGSIETARSRLAEKSGLVNRCYYDANPPHKQHWAHRVFIEGVDPKDRTPLPKLERYASLLMNPIDNLANISEEYMEELNSLSKRKRDRFLHGLWLATDERALWKYDDIMRATSAPDMDRIVVAIDPAVTSKDKSDETGIVVAGRCGNQFYVLDDLSDRYTPKEWANKAVWAYHHYHADRIIGEVNNGGDMIENTIRQVDANASYKSVRATRGKALRAEPVAALYEQHRGYHVGSFYDLEEQMTTPFEELEQDDRSDALVWAATELMLHDTTVSVGSVEL